jgi:hypothetical protein
VYHHGHISNTVLTWVRQAVAHFDEVVATEGYKVLPRHLVDALASELHAHFRRFTALLQQLSSASTQLPSPRSVW